MKRRKFINTLGLSAAAVGLTACGQGEQQEQTKVNKTSTKKNYKGKVIEWTMVTTWPKNFAGLGEGAEYLAQLINSMSGGRMQVKVYGAGELVPALQAFESVAIGAAHMGHGAAYYWRGKLNMAPFFAAVPFGLNAQEMNGWLLHGGGLELWRELYEPVGLIPEPAGNTGVQMAGWFNKEINSLGDVKGLKMRIPGLGGEVWKRAGGIPVLMPGSEVFTSLETGVIDAAEWVGPYNDLAFGLFKAAKYYYHPGWHEPGTTLEAIINKKAYEELPEDLQQIVTNACRTANADMLSQFTARNNEALQTLVEKHGVILKELPQDVLNELATISDAMLAEQAKTDLDKRILNSFIKFRDEARQWHKISEQSYYGARS
ncbi:TRAP transporter substrate-binding protein [Kangiella sp. HZ709]|uniref:TRAP transporter substrate-binding protein n=1 Tax=Kangiella sp. HZ709 TaxID=2666328 RepID=UPI0014169B8A|nr:ABC transporter substrate-binding protein [Kangiella sp. HZ709]